MLYLQTNAMASIITKQKLTLNFTFLACLKRNTKKN